MNGSLHFENLRDLYNVLKHLPSKYKLSFDQNALLSLVNFSEPDDVRLFQKILALNKLKHIHTVFENLLHMYSEYDKDTINSQKDEYKNIIELLLQESLDNKIDLQIYNNDWGFIFDYIKKEGSSRMIDAFAQDINTHFYITQSSKKSSKKTVGPFNPIKTFYAGVVEEGYDKELLYKIMDRIDTLTFIEYLPDDIKNSDFVKNWGKSRSGKGVLDTTIGLRSVGLPSLAIEKIASHAYDTTGFSLYELMSIVTPINEYKNPGVIRADIDLYDEQEYIDV